MTSIYKYLAPERTQALEKSTLRATQANALNDPFELKPFFKNVLERSDIEREIQKKDFFETFMKDAYQKRPESDRLQISWEQFVELANVPEFKSIIESMFSAQMDALDALLPHLSEAAMHLLHEKLGDNVGMLASLRFPTTA